MSLTESDHARRQATLKDIRAQQSSIRSQLDQVYEDQESGLTLEAKVRLEEQLQAALDMEARVLDLARAAKSQLDCEDSMKPKIWVKTEAVLEYGHPTPQPTPRPKKRSGSSRPAEFMDLTYDSDVERPVDTEAQQQPKRNVELSQKSGNAQLATAPLDHSRTAKRRKQSAEKIVVDLTFDSSEDEKPIVKREHSIPVAVSSTTPLDPSTPFDATPVTEPPTQDVKPSHSGIEGTGVAPPHSPCLPVPEEEDVKPVIELDVVGPPRRAGAPRMAGEERVRKVILRVKREGEEGNMAIDERSKESLGPDVVVPKDAVCTGSRAAINHVLGGGVQETFPRVSKDVHFERVKKGDEILCASIDWNPDMPREPGQHGIMLSSMSGFDDDQHISTFVGIAPNSWLYVGECIVFGRAELPTTVWNEMPEATKTTWAQNLLKKKWGQRWLDNLKFPPHKRSLTSILKALATGSIIISIGIMKCVAYDIEIAAAVGDAQKQWVNGTIGSRRLYQKGQTRKWLLTSAGTAWLETTAAGQSWLQDDPEGRRFARFSLKERRRWASESLGSHRPNGATKRKAATDARQRVNKRARRAQTKVESDESEVSEDDGGPLAEARPSRTLPSRSRRNKFVPKSESEQELNSDDVAEEGSGDDYMP